MAPTPNTPITVALIDDYDVVLMGVANMFDRYRDRVVAAAFDEKTYRRLLSLRSDCLRARAG